MRVSSAVHETSKRLQVINMNNTKEMLTFLSVQQISVSTVHETTKMQQVIWQVIS